jgi:hypothetical protein
VIQCIPLEEAITLGGLTIFVKILNNSKQKGVLVIFRTFNIPNTSSSRAATTVQQHTAKATESTKCVAQ